VGKIRSCPHLPFEGRKQNKIKKIIILNSFGLKKTALDARVTIHQFFHRNTSLQPAKTVKKTGKYESRSPSKSEK
jgi:hypothetical protein